MMMFITVQNAERITLQYHGDGTCTCDECGFQFAVVEVEDEDE